MYTRLCVENILRHPKEFKWSVQGLGMMRLYLSDAVRLHIWDSCLRVPGASPLHNHPWDLDSLVIAGKYRQHRYRVVEAKDCYGNPNEEFNMSTIQCGEQACTMTDPEKVFLQEDPLEIYIEGQKYHQDKNEIHVSCPEDGTVTIVSRTFHEDRDHALVLWRGRGGWVDAKPRPATPEEIAEVTQRALTTWF